MTKYIKTLYVFIYCRYIDLSQIWGKKVLLFKRTFDQNYGVLLSLKFGKELSFKPIIKISHHDIFNFLLDDEIMPES
jgi:hypothetical protein